MMLEMKRKVCMVGDEAVGKTALIRRFVYNLFDEAYIRTVGTMVSRREVIIPELDLRMQLMVWDIMGRKEFMDLFSEAYFNHAKGVVAVFDLTRPETLRSLDEWIGCLDSSVGEVPTVVMANKVDLGQAKELSDDAVQRFCDLHGFRWFRTSAKTGKNVDEAVGHLAREILKREEPGGIVPPRQPPMVEIGSRAVRRSL